MLIDFNPAPFPRRGPSPATGNQMTARESEVLELSHLPGVQAAETLGMAYETLRTHRKNVMRKLGAETWTQAALIYERSRTRRAA
jgi:DNA-binding CsgD family transcriptional regulator